MQRVSKKIYEEIGPPLAVLSDCIRGFIVPHPDCDFLCGDFNAIEARVLAWLAGEEGVLDTFRKNEDIYKVAASAIFRIPVEQVTKLQRLVGKVAILALGFGGGVKAFQLMAVAYNIKITDEEARIFKENWRAANKKIVAYWRLLENAAINAVLRPGTEYRAGALGREIRFKKKDDFLFARLPSGRLLCYPYAAIGAREGEWQGRQQFVYMSVDSFTKKWGKTYSWGGTLAENMTQAVARDLLAEAILRCEERHYPIVMHIHDEAVAEVLEWEGDLKEFLSILEEVPPWAEGLPIRAEGWRGKRYKKS